MDYEHAKEKVLTIFYGLPAERQVPYVVKSLKGVYSSDIEIFPMKDFKTFCESHLGGDFGEITAIIQRSMDEGLFFDIKDNWFMWKEKNRTIESAGELTDFIFYEDDLFKTMVNRKDLALLGFSSEDVHEIIEAEKKERFLDGQEYAVILGDDTGKEREVYNPRNVTVLGKIHYDGSWLMENAYINDYFSFGISLKLLDTYRRVMWIGQYANGLDREFDDKPKVSLENTPYYLKVKKNVPMNVEIPDCKAPWRKGVLESLGIDLEMDDLSEKKLKWDDYFLVNKEKKEYVNLRKYIKRSLHQSGVSLLVINPLVVLTTVTSSCLKGDYVGTDMAMVGRWAWNLIGLVKEVPKGFTEVIPTFIEKQINSHD